MLLDLKETFFLHKRHNVRISIPQLYVTHPGSDVTLTRRFRTHHVDGEVRGHAQTILKQVNDWTDEPEARAKWADDDVDNGARDADRPHQEEQDQPHEAPQYLRHGVASGRSAITSTCPSIAVQTRFMDADTRRIRRITLMLIFRPYHVFDPKTCSKAYMRPLSCRPPGCSGHICHDNRAI